MKALKSLFLVVPVALAACSQSASPTLTESGLNPAAFDSVIDGKQTKLLVMKNKAGMEVCVTNFGGRIVSIMAPDRQGKLLDVVLGYDNVAQYADKERNASDFGAAIGRYANRINQGRLVVDGDTIQLPQNNYPHCLHGGPTGWQYKVYDIVESNDTLVKLAITSPDGDNNFPGEVQATVTYTLTADNSIDICYTAKSNEKTVVNMTNHSYFNLNGDGSKDATDMVLYINADNFTPSDSTFMPTGELRPVQGTPMDFRKPEQIGNRVTLMEDEQIRNGNGLDHNWCLNTYAFEEGVKNKNYKGDDTQLAASLYSEKTGILLEVFTDEPGIQVYSGNFLEGAVVGKKNIAYPQRAACCLETQHFPDSPNHPEWPDIFLKPGETYTSHCKYKFSVK